VQSPDNAKLLLTASVFYSSEYTPSLKYPIQAILDSLYSINVMAYDLYTPNSSPNFTRPPALLNGPTSSQLITVDGGVRAWIDAGVPANKLVLGLSFNGYGWVLENADNHGISSPADGPWILGNSVSYRTIQDFIIKTGAIEVIDPSYVTHYCYVDKDWIGYEGKYSIFDKSRYGMEKGLLGYFAWHVADDDDAWTLSNQGNIFLFRFLLFNLSLINHPINQTYCSLAIYVRTCINSFLLLIYSRSFPCMEQ
jgi:chitinase